MKDSASQDVIMFGPNITMEEGAIIGKANESL